MTNPNTIDEAGPMTDLITRLREAEEGSAELDDAIARHIGLYNEKTGRFRTGIQGQESLAARNYTQSIDTALTLVPEGWTTERVHEASASPSERWAWYLIDPNRYRTCGGVAPTPALALCVAALEALHQQQRD